MGYLYFDIIIYVWIVLFGVCIGSFINVVVYRLPKKNLMSKSRSYCPACEQQLGWLDLVPVFSYLFLRGRCRYCDSRISPRYPAVETLCGGFAVLCYARYGFDLRTVLSFGVLIILLAVSLIDFDTMEIPDSLIIALIPFAAAAVWAWGDITLIERIIGFFIISLPMLLLTLVIRNAFGGGDIKLTAVCGFLLGWKNTVLMFFISLLVGGSYAVYLLTRKKSNRGTLIAFGPYLCAGAAAALLYGKEIIDFYLELFL